MLRTLIVEDNPVILESLVETLQELAHVEVVGAVPDARQAESWLDGEHEAFDLMIVDIFLRQGSGLDVLRAAQRRGHPARRVVLSNYATPDVRRSCEALGAEKVFDKSTELEELIRHCQALAEGTP